MKHPKFTLAEMLHYINKFSASFRDEHSKEIFQGRFRDQFEVIEVNFYVVQAEPLQLGNKKESLTLLCAVYLMS